MKTIYCTVILLFATLIGLFSANDAGLYMENTNFVPQTTSIIPGIFDIEVSKSNDNKSINFKLIRK